MAELELDIVYRDLISGKEHSGGVVLEPFDVAALRRLEVIVMSDSSAGGLTRRELLERAGAVGFSAALPGALASRAHAARAVPATIAVSGAQ